MLNMMSSDNKQTLDAIKREIKEMQARCRHAFEIVGNMPLDGPSSSLEQDRENTLCYVESLRTEIENENTQIIADDNLLTSQFLTELQDKTKQVEELVAFTRGSIHDLDAEINRLKTLIKISREARSRPKTNKTEVKPQHVQKAKEHFQMMKEQLHKMMEAIFPKDDKIIMDVMGNLMAEQLDEASDGYIPITSEIYHVIEILKDMKIVTANPYDNMQVKLAY